MSTEYNEGMVVDGPPFWLASCNHIVSQQKQQQQHDTHTHTHTINQTSSFAIVFFVVIFPLPFQPKEADG